LIISRQRAIASADLPASLRDTKKKPVKSLASFTVPHQSPGALSNVLDVFKRHGLNLTSINTTPSRTRPFQYMFFIEFSGSLDDGEEVKEELREAAESFRLWGCWVNQRD
jgi:prephenate dehydratase